MLVYNARVLTLFFSRHCTACTEKDLEAFDLDFASNPKNELAMNIVTHTGS